MNEDPADVLEQAADALFVYGRTVGQARGDGEAMCVRGAIAHVAAGDAENLLVGLSHPATKAVEAYLASHPELLTDDERRQQPSFVNGDSRFPIFVWNDHREVNPENDALVIDTLRAAAKELRRSEAL